MQLRNVAIIAHVDHGKTTLVDRLLQQSGSFRENQRVAERAMDSNDLERERGITILAKVTSIHWHDTRINIVDSALVLVDAAEGPLPQTKFVVSKALKVGLKPIVVINKVDRPDARPTEVINEVFDLFAALDEAEAGDIVAIAGLTKGTVADTFCDPSVDTPLRAQPIDPPTVSMSFIVNNSPLAGTEGDKVTSRMIRDRLLREAEGNVALRVTEAADKDSMEVSGRGELQLAILIETMRREGFELSVSRPRVVLKKDEATGEWQEPVEEVVIDVDEEHSGVVVQKMSERKAEMIEMRPSGGHRLRLVFYAPTRGLIGYQGELLTDTRGTAIMNRLFHNYAPYKGDIQGRRNGVLISNDQGEAVACAMFKLEDRGPMMITPGCKVYKGMIVGEHTRDNDLEINILKGKQLTNIRTTSKDEAVRLTPPIQMTLEKALAYIEDDELVEVTPKSIRLRKKFLDANDRKRAEKAKEAVA